jgi:cardiolipin synthase A/B
MEAIWTLLGWLFVLYLIAAAIFIVLDNRPPASTFAWLLLFILLPGLGMLIYIFFGRNLRVLAERKKLTRQTMGSDLTAPLAPLIARQSQALQSLGENSGQSLRKQRLAEMLSRTQQAVLTLHNQVEILQDASEKYPRLEADVRQAQHTIHMQYFIWQADSYMRDFGELLIAKAQEGVRVRILFDAAGSFALMRKHKEYLGWLRHGGIEIYAYLNYLHPFKLHTINYRNHRKIAVIDGRIGYTGGLNMGDEHLKGAGPYHAWRDTHLRLTGEAVGILQGIFVTGWYNTTKEKLEGAKLYQMEANEEQRLLVQLVGSGPDSQWYAIQQLYFFMILAAEKSVYIQSPFFIPDPSIAEALAAAALSGVKVYIMCAPRDTENSLANWAANTYFCDIVRAGAHVFLYQPGYLHAKTMCIDEEFCSIGTANLDMRSLQVNYEVNTVLYDQKLAGQLAHDFMHDLEQCVEFDLAAYRRRPLHLRLRDSLARLMSYQL